MSILRTGSNQKYAENWAKVFGKRKKTKSITAKTGAAGRGTKKGTGRGRAKGTTKK